MHIDYRVMKYRPNVVSVLIGCRFLEKIMFSFQTLHVLCELRKSLTKYRIMLYYIIVLYYRIFFWNL